MKRYDTVYFILTFTWSDTIWVSFYWDLLPLSVDGTNSDHRSVHYQYAHRLSRNSTSTASYLRIKLTLLMCQLLTCSPTSKKFPYHFRPFSTTVPSVSEPPHYRGFTITLRHTTFGRNPLDEWSARSRDLYLTIHNTVKGQTAMLRAGVEQAILASERPRTDASGRAVAVIGTLPCYVP
jgi:hypothetical protein